MESTSDYSRFTSPIRNGDEASFDVHVYFDNVRFQRHMPMIECAFNGLMDQQHSEREVTLMTSMRQAIKENFPELIVYDIHNKAIGPHPLPMFEVDLSSPAQFGAFIPWLAINHGPLSVLIHPNTGNSRLDHTEHAIWIGDKLPLKLDTFDRVEQMDEVARRLQDVLAKDGTRRS